MAAMCVLAQTQFLPSVTLNTNKTDGIDEGEIKNVVDNLSDIARTLVSRIPWTRRR